MTKPSEHDVRAFLGAHYQEPISNFHAIIAPADGNWLYYIGSVQRAQSPACGEYVVAGSGAEFFTRMAAQMTPSESVVPPELEALRIASDLMAQEIITGAPVRASFGGGYEVFFAGEQGFERVDDVIHIFRAVKVWASNHIEIGDYPRVIRQWYDGPNYASLLSRPPNNKS